MSAYQLLIITFPHREVRLIADLKYFNFHKIYTDF